ncbi:hypothetical protein STENM327S_07993 [Streptomyces tendae]
MGGQGLLSLSRLLSVIPTALRVTGIDAYAARLAAHGTPVTWDDGLPGHRRFHCADPVGNRLEFLEPDGPARR